MADPWTIEAPRGGSMGSDEVGGEGPPRAPSSGSEAPLLFLLLLLFLLAPSGSKVLMMATIFMARKI
jgi:hypothetical protein